MKKCVCLIFFAAIQLSLVAAALAGTVYVDAANSMGIEDGTQTYPYNEIQEAINAALSGDTVSVAPGIYYGALEMKQGVKVIAEQGPEVTIIDGMGNYAGIIPPYGYSATIDIAGFTIRNATALIEATNRAYYNFACTAIVDNCILEGGYYGIRGIYGTIANVSRTLFKNMRYAISGWNIVRAICNNVTIDNVDIAIGIDYVKSSPGVTLNNTTISNCKVAVNLPSSSRFYWTPKVVGSNNNFWNCETAVREYFSPYHHTVVNELTTSTFNDPLFVDSVNGDFHLQSGSPLIDAGLDVGLPFSGSAPDVGAYEFDDISLVDLTQILIESTQEIPPPAFKNVAEQRRNALINKLTAVLEDLNTITEETAIGDKLVIIKDCANKLRKDILAKADGTFGGNPKNDWITEADEQQAFYPEVLMLVEDIEGEIAALSAEL